MNRLLLAAAMIGLGLSANPAAAEVNQPTYNADGAVVAPDNYRAWVYVGTPLTPNALNRRAAP